MRILVICKLFLVAMFLLLITGRPGLILGGFCFAFVLYGLFWLCLPPEKRSGWGYKSCGGAVTTTYDGQNSNDSSIGRGYDILDDYRNHPAFKSMGDNIYHDRDC